MKMLPRTSWLFIPFLVAAVLLIRNFTLVEEVKQQLGGPFATPIRPVSSGNNVTPPAENQSHAITHPRAANTTLSTEKPEDFQEPTNKNELRISFQLQKHIPYNNPFSPYYLCPLDGMYEQFHPLPDALQGKGILDFTTTISTNLRILTMGDSVGILFGQSLEKAAGASLNNRKVFGYSFAFNYPNGRDTEHHEGIAISAPIRGGGIMAIWRLTGWLLRAGEGKRPANAKGGGWNRKMLRHCSTIHTRIRPAI